MAQNGHPFRGRALPLLLSLLLTLAPPLAACRPAAEGDAAGNGTDGARDRQPAQAAAAPTPRLTGLHWQEEIVLQNYTLTIDLDVEVPEGGPFPVCAVERADFAGGDARVAQALACLPAQVKGARPGGDTKEEVYRLMQSMLRGAYDEQLGQFVPPDGEEARRIVAEMTRRAAAAPEADGYEPARGVKPVAPGTRWAYYLANGEEWDVLLEPDLLRIERLPGGSVQAEHGARRDGAVDRPPEQAALTRAAAEAAVEDFLARSDIGAFGILRIEPARLKRNYTGETISEGYRATCVRVCAGCRPLDLRQCAGFGARFGDGAQAAGLPPETLTLYVDGGGVRQLIWADPLAVVETAQSGELLPFAWVQALIRQALRASLGRAGDGADGSAVSNGRVSAVVLTSCCIPQEDAPGRFLLTPAWVALISHGDPQRRGGAPQAIVLSAVDGSRIGLRRRTA